MDIVTNLEIPESMSKGIDSLSKKKGCSSNTIIKLAIAKFLFDQTLPSPEVYRNNQSAESVPKQRELADEIPLERIISVQYTLDDGRTIHVIRQRKNL